MLGSSRARNTLFLVLFFAIGVLGAVASDSPALFRRQQEVCDPPCPPASCDTCAEGTTCVFISQKSCNECQRVVCKEGKEEGQKVSPGAAAGAALGGLAAAGIVGFFGFRICTRRQQRARASMAVTAAEKENDFGMMRSARASTHTVASIASTVRTRASNIIQIAYIPGVTNRSQPSTPTHPSHAVPPVPPLPFAESPNGSQFPRSQAAGDIQFGAEDLLRNSMVTVNDNRSSIATTIYGGNAVVSQPNVVRAGKAAVVEVKPGTSVTSSGQNSPSVPPVPALFSTGGAPNRNNLGAVPPSPAFSIGSTFFNRVNGRRESDSMMSLDTPTNDKTKWRDTMDSEAASLSPCTHRPNLRASHCSSCITDMDTGSPFSDKNSVMDALPVMVGTTPAGSVNRVSMNPMPKRTLSAVGSGSLSERTASPFSDDHSIDQLKQR